MTTATAATTTAKNFQGGAKARTASEAYGEHYSAILAIVQALPAEVGNMAADAQRVNWAHVGDLSALSERFRALADQVEMVRRAHVNAGATQ